MKTYARKRVRPFARGVKMSLLVKLSYLVSGRTRTGLGIQTRASFRHLPTAKSKTGNYLPRSEPSIASDGSVPPVTPFMAKVGLVPYIARSFTVSFAPPSVPVVRYSQIPAKDGLERF